MGRKPLMLAGLFLGCVAQFGCRNCDTCGGSGPYDGAPRTSGNWPQPSAATTSQQNVAGTRPGPVSSASVAADQTGNAFTPATPTSAAPAWGSGGMSPTASARAPMTSSTSYPSTNPGYSSSPGYPSSPAYSSGPGYPSTGDTSWTSRPASSGTPTYPATRPTTADSGLTGFRTAGDPASRSMPGTSQTTYGDDASRASFSAPARPAQTSWQTDVGADPRPAPVAPAQGTSSTAGPPYYGPGGN